jgi:hypothetical protein
MSGPSTAAAQYTMPPPVCGTTVLETNCAFIFVKPSFIVKNLHPQVTKVSVWCATKIGEPDTWVKVESPQQGLTAGDASYPSGGIPVRMGSPKASITPGQVFVLTCELLLTRTAAAGTVTKAPAAASATAPLTPTDTNWNQVAAGSVVKWTQNVTFPSVTP